MLIVIIEIKKRRIHTWIENADRDWMISWEMISGFNISYFFQIYIQYNKQWSTFGLIRGIWCRGTFPSQWASRSTEKCLNENASSFYSHRMPSTETSNIQWISFKLHSWCNFIVSKDLETSDSCNRQTNNWKNSRLFSTWNWMLDTPTTDVSVG